MFYAPLPPWVPISQPFKPGQHYGIDYAAPTGTPVTCAAAGFVRYKATEGDGYGNTLTVEHADGWESRYAHLLTFPVNQGENVAAGQVIAETGGGQGPPGAGFSTGPHLHYELRQWGVAVDPYPLVTWAPPAGMEDEMSEADMATLGQWMQEQTGIILDVLLGPGWQGHKGMLAAWANDTRAIVNAHTTAVVSGDADDVAYAVDVQEAAAPLELEPLGADDLDDDGLRR